MFDMLKELRAQAEANNKRWKDFDKHSVVLQDFLDKKANETQALDALCKTVLLLLEQLRPAQNTNEQIEEAQKDIEKMLKDFGKLKK